MQKQVLKSKLLLLLLTSALFVSCNSKADKNNNTSQSNSSLKIENVGEVFFSSNIESRNDIPFALLIDEEFKQKLPDTTNYEIYRPASIFLEKGFNEKDSTQLKSFPSITITVLPQQINLMDSMLVENIITLTRANIEGTNYKIIDWTELDSQTPVSDTIPSFRLAYTQLNEKKKEEMKVISQYIFRDKNLVIINLSSPQKNYDEWKPYFDQLIKNIKFD